MKLNWWGEDQVTQRCINVKTYHDFHFKNDCISFVSTELSPLILRLTNWQIAVSYPRESWFANMTRLPSRFQRSLGRGSNDTELFHRFVVSLGTRRAAWRRSQGCDCVARGLKWKINLCPWILRWICGRGHILAWDFWLHSAGCPTEVFRLVLSL